MGSLNGTLVNSRSVSHRDSGSRKWGGPVELASEDIITLGTTTKVYVSGFELLKFLADSLFSLLVFMQYLFIFGRSVSHLRMSFIYPSKLVWPQIPWLHVEEAGNFQWKMFFITSGSFLGLIRLTLICDSELFV